MASSSRRGEDELGGLGAGAEVDGHDGGTVQGRHRFHEGPVLGVRRHPQRRGDRLVGMQGQRRVLGARRLGQRDLHEPAGGDLDRLQPLRGERPLRADHLDLDASRGRAGIQERQDAGARSGRCARHDHLAFRRGGRLERLGSLEDGRRRVHGDRGERPAAALDVHGQLGLTGGEITQVDASHGERLDDDAIGVDRVDRALGTPERDVGDGRRRRQVGEHQGRQMLRAGADPEIPAVVDGRRARAHDQAPAPRLGGGLAEEADGAGSPAALVDRDAVAIDRVATPAGRVGECVDRCTARQALGGRGRARDHLSRRHRHPTATGAAVGRSGDGHRSGRTVVLRDVGEDERDSEQHPGEHGRRGGAHPLAEGRPDAPPGPASRHAAHAVTCCSASSSSPKVSGT